jgi:transcriptional regulator with XRE-family HTH domain
MPDPTRFPVSCAGWIVSTVFDELVEAPSSSRSSFAGTSEHRCGSKPQVWDAMAELAPLPPQTGATVWSEISRLDSDARGADAENVEQQAVLSATPQGSEYRPGSPSLLDRFVVYETDRQLEYSVNTGRNFGSHVRALRRARGMTQDILATRSGLSADTIRRLEHGGISPSLETLRKLCLGLNLLLSTLFESFELGDLDHSRELRDLLASRSAGELVLAGRVLRALFDELDSTSASANSDNRP